MLSQFAMVTLGHVWMKQLLALVWSRRIRQVTLLALTTFVPEKIP